MKKTIFKGMATALVTPMKEDLTVDYEAFGRFIDFQIEKGINAIVAVGTTGESATLEPSEQKEVIRFAVERAAGRVPVIGGTGTNNTAHVLEYVTIQKEVQSGDQSLAGQIYVITGSLEQFVNRDAMKAFIEERGGKVTGSVTKKTTALINNDITSNSSKNKKAKELGVPIVTEAAFLESVNG